MALLVFPETGDSRTLDPNTLWRAYGATKKLGLKLRPTPLPRRLRIIGVEGSPPGEALLQALERQGFRIER